MANAFPLIHIRQAICCSGAKQIYTGEPDPNGYQTANKYDLYIQIRADGTSLIWVKTVEGGNQDWV